MYARFAIYPLFKFSSISPSRLCSLASSSSSTLSNYPLLSSTFEKLLQNNYLTHHSLPSLFQSFLHLPPFPLSTSTLLSLHSLLNPHLHRLTDLQLFHSIIYLSKSDPLFHQSKLFQYLTKNYLQNPYQLLQLNLKFSSEMSIWKIIKHSISRVLIMRYGSDAPPFRKEIAEVPEEIRRDVVLELAKNQYVRGTKVFEKMYGEIFEEVKGEYEESLGGNLYHPLGNVFQVLLMRNVEVWCLRGEAIDERNEMMREFVMKMVMVMEEKKGVGQKLGEDGKEGEKKVQKEYVSEFVREYWIMYQFIEKNYEKSEQKMKYLDLLKNYIRSNASKVPKEIPYHHLIQYLQLITNPQINIQQNQQFLENIGNNFSKLQYFPQPLFSSLISTLKTSQPFNHSFSSHASNILPFLSFPQLLVLPSAYASPSLVCSIFHRIIQLQDFDLSNQNILQLLSLLRIYSKVDGRKEIKNFMFKYISDNYQGWDEEMRGKVFEVLEKFEDKHETFDDTGMYKGSVFQEIRRSN